MIHPFGIRPASLSLQIFSLDPRDTHSGNWSWARYRKGGKRTADPGCQYLFAGTSTLVSGLGLNLLLLAADVCKLAILDEIENTLRLKFSGFLVLKNAIYTKGNRER